MSDYSRSKVVRLKATLEELEVKDKFPNLFGNSDVGMFEIAPTEEAFIDYVLFHSYGEECDDWGRTRELTEKELSRYIPIFQQILPTVRKEQLRYVDYCFYNCTEAPDYFDEQDDFFDEI